MILSQQLLTLGVVIAALQLCRWLPFWLFPAHRPTPLYIQYLGRALPPAVFGMLVIYCFDFLPSLSFGDSFCKTVRPAANLRQWQPPVRHTVHLRFLF